jgi:hypothetical protein
MMMRHSLTEGGNNTVLDEFLGQQQQQQQGGEVHNRQESADSGLGMGSNFNLGSIPEVRDYITNTSSYRKIRLMIFEHLVRAYFTR